MDKDYVISVIQNILNTSHANEHPAKKVINVNIDDIAFADPIGGDSKKNPYEKRAHLYWNSMMVICYDDEGYKMPFIEFCKKFKVNIDAEQRIAIYNHVDSNISYSSSDNQEYLSEIFNDLIDINDFCEKVNTDADVNISNLKPLEFGSRQHYYLSTRGIKDDPNIYQADYNITSEWTQPVIVIFNRKNDKILGMQLRNLESGRKRMFKIYNYEKILEIYDKGKLENLIMNKLVLYNKLSYLFNIMNVNFNNTITIFEGYLDSIFYRNSIGVVGVNSDTKFLENNNLDIQYFFDNDKAGWRKSESKIKEGFKVFLWEKMLDDIVKSKNTKDPYRLKNRISKIKDMNQLYNLNSKLPFNKWFSSDVYDLMYIPKKKFYKRS